MNHHKQLEEYWRKHTSFHYKVGFHYGGNYYRTIQEDEMENFNEQLMKDYVDKRLEVFNTEGIYSLWEEEIACLEKIK